MLLLFMAVFFVRNLLLPMASDDIPYAFIWDGADRGNLLDGVGERQRITSFADIVVSQYSHYMTWGGRILGIGLTQLFAWEGKHLFNILNPLVFTALALLIFRMATGLQLRQMNRTYMLWILIAFWLLLPDSFQTTLWMCGSCVFLWMAVIELLFLLPFALKYWNPQFWQHPPRWSTPLMAFAGLCAGWSVETGAAATAFITFFALLHFWRHKQLAPWMVVGFVCLCLGLAMLVLAPGEVVRLELQALYEYNPDMPPEEYWTRDMYMLNLLDFFSYVLTLQTPMYALVIISIVHRPKGKRWDAAVRFQTVLVAAALVVMTIMVFVPNAPGRAGFFPTVCVLMASLTGLRQLMPSLVALRQRHRLMVRGMVAAVAVAWAAFMGVILYVECDVRSQWMARIDYINAHQDQDLVVVHQIDVPPIADKLCEYWFYSSLTWDTELLAWGADLEPRPEGSHNLMYAQYYGWKRDITDGEDRREPDD